MKRTGFSLLITMLLLAFFTFGVYSQADDPTPTPAAEESPLIEVEDTSQEEVIQALITEAVAITPLVDVRTNIPILIPLFLPPTITDVQVVTVPVFTTLALPVADLALPQPITGVDLITLPLTLDLVLQVAPSGTITVVSAGLPVISAAAFYTPTPVVTAEVTAEVTGTVVVTGANLRSGPGTNYPRVGGLTAGQAIEIVGRDERGAWYQLADGTWIAAFLVENAPEDLSVVEAPPVPTPTAVLTPTATATPVLTPTPTETATPTTDTAAVEPVTLYLETATALATTVDSAVLSLTDLLGSPQLADATWQQDVIAQTVLIQDAYAQLAEVVPPVAIADVHETLLGGVSACRDAADALVSAIDAGDEEAIETAAVLIQGCGEAIGAVDLE